MLLDDYEAIIGLEVHCQLATDSKIFCTCSARPEEQQTISEMTANQNTCPICAGHPGVLPRLNKKAVELAVKMGIACGCDIRPVSVFARKNYFYPDLPKGYQISQYDKPICENGRIIFESPEGEVSIALERIHLEEDAGKNLHLEDFSLINLNRAGVGLIEIVSKPQIRSAKQASQYLKTLHALVTYLNISDGNMQEGNFRCDANVSVRKKGDPKLGTRTEIKNVNSFKFVEKAIEYEIIRQMHCLENGQKVIQETRMYDATQNKTITLRTKEKASDYRYFPEPDLPPLVLNEDFIEQIRKTMPELLHAKKQRYMQQYQLSSYDAGVLISSKSFIEYFEASMEKLPSNLAKSLCNILTSEVARLSNEANIELEQSLLKSQHLIDLVQALENKIISVTAAKEVLGHIWQTGSHVSSIIEKHGLAQISNQAELETLVEQVILENPIQTKEYKAGKAKLLGFFVGQAMKKMQGKANPVILNDLFKKKLSTVE